MLCSSGKKKVQLTQGEDVLRKRLALSVMALVSAATVGQLPALAQKSASIDISKRVQRAREITVIVSDKLRAELGAALKIGAVDAISACQTISPDLATNASDEFGYEVSRTALKLRNPENGPDEWEQKVLHLFQAKIATGADPAKLEYHEVLTTPEGDKLFRYMRPIMMADMCMTCHGTDVKQEVKAEIARYYPEDKALGHKLGEMRGAFSLAQLIEE